jgi:hypothetical protein
VDVFGDNSCGLHAGLALCCRPIHTNLAERCWFAIAIAVAHAGFVRGISTLSNQSKGTDIGNGSWQ